jgi:alpha-L-fucosidase
VGIRWNSFFGVHDFTVNGTGEFQKKRQVYYNQMVEGMVTELCTQYGPLFEIWFDGGASHPDLGAPDVLPIVKKYQPDCLFYHNNQLAEARWGGSESGTVPYPCWATFPTPYSHAGDTTADHRNLLKHGDPDGAYWMPAMSDAPLRGYNGRHEWFWEPGDEEHIFPLEKLMHMYYNSVGHNSTLIMGLTPDPRGLLPEADVRRLEEWGAAIKKTFSKSIASTSARGGQIVLSLDNPQTISKIVIQEDIAKGHRVRAYRIQAYTKGQWKIIAQGESIGHKRIHQIQPIEVEQLKLVIDQKILPPIIEQFGVY